MTQVDSILDIFRNIRFGELLDITELQKTTGFPRESIRRVLSGLAKSKEINRVEPGLFSKGEKVVEEPFRRKFIGTQKYKGNPRQFFAITFENNDEDRERELLEALSDFLNNEQYVESAGNTGYAADDIQEVDVDMNFIYPRIQVGEL